MITAGRERNDSPVFSQIRWKRSSGWCNGLLQTKQHGALMLSLCVCGGGGGTAKIKICDLSSDKFFFLRNLQSTSALLSSFFVLFLFHKRWINMKHVTEPKETQKKNLIHWLVCRWIIQCLRRPVYWRGQYSKTVKRKRNEEKNT